MLEGHAVCLPDYVQDLPHAIKPAKTTESPLKIESGLSQISDHA
jgi:hypothetical protein